MTFRLDNPYSSAVRKFAQEHDLDLGERVEDDVYVDLVSEPITFGLKLTELLKAGMGIFGQTGTGKSVTLGSLLEEFVIAKVPFTVFDLEGDFTTLGELDIEEKENLRVVDGKKLTDADEIGAIAEESLLGGKQTVINLADVVDTFERRSIVYSYVAQLYHLAKQHRLLHILVLDEAQQFIPEATGFKAETSGAKDIDLVNNLISLASLVATQGRKRGIHLIIASQRVAQVRKSVLTQLKNFILHKLSNMAADESAYNDFLASIPKNARSICIATARQFKPGEAYFLLETRGIKKVRIRLRRTTHVGKTPDLRSSLKSFERYNKQNARSRT